LRLTRTPKRIGFAVSRCKNKRKEAAFAVAAIVRKNFPLLSRNAFKTDGRPLKIKMAREAVEHLWNCFSDDANQHILSTLSGTLHFFALFCCNRKFVSLQIIVFERQGFEYQGRSFQL